jgi:acetylornithine/succinyldiaminopimelate/putrescine aminotransferase
MEDRELGQSGLQVSGGDTPSARKRKVVDLTREYLMPGRLEAWSHLGIPLVIGRREGYRIWDIDGHELLDLHLNGGTYNLGHRHPELMEALREALAHLDIGNHHFPSEARATLAERLAQVTPGDLHYTVFVPSGSEANDLAIRVARRVTGRRKIVALEEGFHGRTGLSAAAGQDDIARFFLSDYPAEFLKVPFNDLEAMERTLSAGDVAAVLMETLPATYGFPVPSDEYLPGVKALCERHGTLYIADEVQTGLGRTGHLWAVGAWGIQPDLLVIGKGLSGGLYPFSALVMSKRAGSWLHEHGWGYVSTFGGAEIGCHVALRVLDICSQPESLANARRIGCYLGEGLRGLAAAHRRLRGVRQKGLVMGLQVEGGQGAIELSRALYRRGVWAMFSGFDLSVLQFKPGLLVDEAYCDLVLERLDAALSDIEMVVE